MYKRQEKYRETLRQSGRFLRVARKDGAQERRDDQRRLLKGVVPSSQSEFRERFARDGLRGVLRFSKRRFIHRVDVFGVQFFQIRFILRVFKRFTRRLDDSKKLLFQRELVPGGFIFFAVAVAVAVGVILFFFLILFSFVENGESKEGRRESRRLSDVSLRTRDGNIVVIQPQRRRR